MDAVPPYLAMPSFLDDRCWPVDLESSDQASCLLVVVFASYRRSLDSKCVSLDSKGIVGKFQNGLLGRGYGRQIPRYGR